MNESLAAFPYILPPTHPPTHPPYRTNVVEAKPRAEDVDVIKDIWLAEVQEGPELLLCRGRGVGWWLVDRSVKNDEAVRMSYCIEYVCVGRWVDESIASE